jgi:hypothetical protein
MLNDTDTKITKEEGMRRYLQQMRATGKLPDLCKERIKLVRHLLVDLQATSFADSAWAGPLGVDEK